MGAPFSRRTHSGQRVLPYIIETLYRVFGLLIYSLSVSVAAHVLNTPLPTPKIKRKLYEHCEKLNSEGV